MENFNAKNYRDNLAKDLKEIRKTDPEKAQEVLSEAQQTEEYQEAKRIHQESRENKEVLFAIQEALLKQEGVKIPFHQIATNLDEISTETKAYVGPIEKNIFHRLSSLEYAYANEVSSERKVIFSEMVVGGKSREELYSDLDGYRLSKMSNPDSDIINSNDLQFTENSHSVNLIEISVESLFNDKYGGYKINKIYDKANEFGLELCPQDIALYYVLKQMGGTENRAIFFGMKPVNVKIASSIFCVRRTNLPHTPKEKKWFLDHQLTTGGHGYFDVKERFIFSIPTQGE